MLKIGISGVPSSGKTTLARAIIAEYKTIYHTHVELVNEYARRYIAKYGEVTSILEQYRILKKQLEWEDSIVNDKLDLFITDSPVFIGFMYCCQMPKLTNKETMFFGDIFKEMTKLNFPIPRYNIIFHLNPINIVDNDGIRTQIQSDKDWRIKTNNAILHTFSIFSPKLFHVINTTNFNDRIQECLNIINKVKTECLLLFE